MSPGVHKRTPPSDHAMRCLAAAERTPYPTQDINFTVRDKLELFGYATIEWRPSPYRTHKPGHKVTYLVITDVGREALRIWREKK